MHNESMGKKSAEKIMYDAFMASGNPGYYMLYSALKEHKLTDENGESHLP